MSSSVSIGTVPLTLTTYRSNQPRSGTDSCTCSDSACLAISTAEVNNNHIKQGDRSDKIRGEENIFSPSTSPRSNSDVTSCTSSLLSPPDRLIFTEESPIIDSNSSSSSSNKSDSSQPELERNKLKIIIDDIKKAATMICNPNTPFINRLLRQTVLADKLCNYPLLNLISLNGKYAAIVVLATYIILLTGIWIPCWLLSKIITEMGVYTLILTGIIYGGRCLLRLLAFPGTNVKVYGEIEMEFARYSCKMLEGAVDAMEDFVNSLLSCSQNNSEADGMEKSVRVLGNDEFGGWTSLDIPATYKRVGIFRDRVLGVYWQVLHCLLEEDGKGLSTTISSSPSKFGENDDSSNNNFYRLGGICCDRRDISVNDLRLTESPTKGLSTLGGLITGDVPKNNPLQGDIGNMTNLSPKAKSDGRALYELLTSLLSDLAALEESLSNNILRSINSRAELKLVTLSMESQDLAMKLLEQMNILKDLVKAMKPTKHSKAAFPGEEDEKDEYSNDEDSDVGPEAVRHHLEEQAASSSPTPIGMIKSAFEAFTDMIDPKPHQYIFGLDVIRGCVLARHRGARQFWVNRSGSNVFGRNGKLDVMVIPSPSSSDSDSLQTQLPLSPREGRSPLKSAKSGRKAVLYCNPNAGLAEVATGMGLTSGNIDGSAEAKDPSHRSWTSYYTEHGYDIYLFNYAGYGRSYGGSSCNEMSSEFAPGFVGAMKRIFFNIFVGFTPSSESLKADATDVATYIVENIGVDQLIIHGESIGGMSAAGAARALTESGRNDTISLLICDRAFCNLNAVAQRLVGGWTGNAIKILTPTWSTDVAHDFLAARCAKIVANDASDEIIHDHSSLKSGIAFAKELMKGSTSNVGWMIRPPLQYRIADLTSQALPAKNPPTWPADKHISFDESFHFAACVRRLGKLATLAKRQVAEAQSDEDETEDGIELLYLSDEASTKSSSEVSAKSNDSSSTSSALIEMWKKLSCCDGLCGAPLGASVKEGMDVSLSWLTSTLIFGTHVLLSNAKKRLKKKSDRLKSGSIMDDHDMFQVEDFDSRPDGYDEYALVTHPIPIPEVISSLKAVVAKNLIPEGQ